MVREGQLITDLIERPAAYEWCEFSNVDHVDVVPAAHHDKARAKATVTIAASVMAVALLAGALIAGIELVEALSSSAITFVRSH